MHCTHPTCLPQGKWRENNTEPKVKGVRAEACRQSCLHARSVSGTNQVLLDLGCSNLVSLACAEGFLGGLQPLEVVGVFLNGRCILVHLTVSQPARCFVSDHPGRHFPVADDVL